MNRSFTGVVAALFVAICAVPTPVKAGVANEAQCLALKQADFSGTVDAPSHILEARIEASNSDQPALCRVTGLVRSNTGFEMHLPLERWNGKFLQAGCAGFCGRTMGWYCRDATARGYACIVSDMGHRSALASPAAPSLSALWAYGSDSAQIDHGFRSSHATTVIGKELVQRLYGRSPDRSYFNGCSEGGREALIAAQRFPWDFDGIIAGAPAMDAGRTFLTALWNERALHDQQGRPILDANALTMIRSAVLKSCDKNDGIVDGVIGDPGLCRFDPAEMMCDEGAGKQCLSPQQVQSVRALIDGPATSSGQSIAPGLSPAAAFGRLLAPGTSGRSVAASYGEEFFRYLGFSPAPGVGWNASEFDFDRDWRRTGVVDALLSATNPDLRRFRDAGGKLIIYHGWDDYLISPAITSDYFETVEAAMGGREATSAFARLFMVPGMDHCALGGGAWSVDFLSYLDEWADEGKAPDQLVAHRPILPSDPAAAFARIGRYPVPAPEIEFSRPLYPYPQRYHYKGKGDTSQESSFGKQANGVRK